MAAVRQWRRVHERRLGLLVEREEPIAHGSQTIRRGRVEPVAHQLHEAGGPERCIEGDSRTPIGEVDRGHDGRHVASVRSIDVTRCSVR